MLAKHPMTYFLGSDFVRIDSAMEFFKFDLYKKFITNSRFKLSVYIYKS